jgi:hypothetical protein
MNVVCLTGTLEAAPASGFPIRNGWSRALVQVPRRGPRGEEEPGVFRFVIVLPPGIAGHAAQAREDGSVVSVVGLLAVDTDYSAPTPQRHYVVIAETLERLAVG